jgi:hypothetical protein
MERKVSFKQIEWRQYSSFNDIQSHDKMNLKENILYFCPGLR